uniref:Uncharacterized protein n=1 Tax=Oryza punctata TaxID=4537 RepID=A0A0E0M7H9_ORYPU
ENRSVSFHASSFPPHIVAPPSLSAANACAPPPLLPLPTNGNTSTCAAAGSTVVADLPLPNADLATQCYTPIPRRDTCLSTSDLLPTHPQTPSLIPRHGHHTHRGPSPLKSIPRLDQRHRRRTHSSLSTPATNTPICALSVLASFIGST